jgi:hypothetical protein
MEFRNLTPFDALSYTALDAKDREYNVVAMSVGYQLKPSFPGVADSDPRGQIYRAEVMDQDPLSLCLADEHWDDPATSSLRRESDLVPYKPKCDVVVTGKAYSAQARQLLRARLQLNQGNTLLIDKTLRLTGPRTLSRTGGLDGFLREGLNPTRAYKLSIPHVTTEVDLRYELAFGGTCQVVDPRRSTSSEPVFLVNEVCYRNPFGRGWMVQGYFDALAKTKEGLPDTLPAPQITLESEPFERMVQTAQSGSMTAVQMAAINYGVTVAGFGPLCKAWAPRLAKAGTYNDEWTAHRHPYLPEDFDFNYWNGAPQDQKIAFPDLTQGLRLTTEGLIPTGGRATVVLPAHRGFALMRFDNGLVLPMTMQVDTIELDTVHQQVRMVWRAAVLKSTGIRVMEARFETDPKAPLMKLAKPNSKQG